VLLPERSILVIFTYILSLPQWRSLVLHSLVIAGTSDTSYIESICNMHVCFGQHRPNRSKQRIVQNPSDADLLRCRIYRRIIPFCLSGENRYGYVTKIWYINFPYLCRLHWSTIPLRVQVGNKKSSIFLQTTEKNALFQTTSVVHGCTDKVRCSHGTQSNYKITNKSTYN
jgi:hypothetical protein